MLTGNDRFLGKVQTFLVDFFTVYSLLYKDLSEVNAFQSKLYTRSDIYIFTKLSFIKLAFIKLAFIKLAFIKLVSFDYHYSSHCKSRMI